MATPVLLLASPGPGGTPNPLLLAGADEAYIPAGGRPMGLLRRWDLIRQVTVSPHFVMAGTVLRDGDRVLRGHPLTGAEMQHPQGLMHIDGPEHSRIRRLIDPLLNPVNLPVGARQEAAALTASISAAGPGAVDVADAVRSYCATLICRALGAPLADRPKLDWFGRMAFGAVHSPMAASVAAQTWQEEYEYFTWLARQPGGGLARSIPQAMTASGYTIERAVYVTANVANGFTAVPPVLLACLMRAAAGHRPAGLSWHRLVTRLIGEGAMFPVDLPRVALEGATLRGCPVEPGSLWLPVLIAAAQNGAPASVAWGPGPHRCPGAALAVQMITLAVSALLTALPGLRFGPVTWLPRTLAEPDTLRGYW
jgi:cytochrome P450